MGQYLVVGAGFAGAVYARLLAENGDYATVIETTSSRLTS